MYILGISGLYHDSASALIRDGKIVAAAQEERFTRIKHDAHMPVNAIRYCLNEAGISGQEVDAVVYYDQPLLTLERFMNNALSLGERAGDLIDNTYDTMFSHKLWIHEQIKDTLGGVGKGGKTIGDKASHFPCRLSVFPFAI
jgi:carbamoyltransferase